MIVETIISFLIPHPEKSWLMEEEERLNEEQKMQEEEEEQKNVHIPSDEIVEYPQDLKTGKCCNL